MQACTIENSLASAATGKSKHPRDDRRNRVVVALESVSKMAADITDDRALGSNLRRCMSRTGLGRVKTLCQKH
jgi:hypothetical protein